MAVSERCSGCGLVIRRGQPRYTAMEPEKYWHWDCHEASVLSLAEAATRVPAIWVKIEEGLGRLKKII